MTAIFSTKFLYVFIVSALLSALFFGVLIAPKNTHAAINASHVNPYSNTTIQSFSFYNTNKTKLYGVKYREHNQDEWKLKYAMKTSGQVTRVPIQMKAGVRYEYQTIRIYYNGKTSRWTDSKYYTVPFKSSLNSIIQTTSTPSTTSTKVSGVFARTTANSAVIGWNPVPDATFYELVYWQVGNKQNSGVVLELSKWSYMFLLSLEPNTQYAVKVKAKSGGIYRKWSNTYYIQTQPHSGQYIQPATKPYPSIINTKTLSNTQVELRWKGIANSQFYLVGYSFIENNKWTPEQIQLTQSTELILSVVPYTQYKIRIIAIHDTGVQSDSYNYYLDTHFVYHDGGRYDAGYTDSAGDCAVRAISIATGQSYTQVYQDLKSLTESYYNGQYEECCENGTSATISDIYLKQKGWKVWSHYGLDWDSPGINKGTVIVHAKSINNTYHLFTMVNGVIYDKFSPYQNQYTILRYYKKG